MLQQEYESIQRELSSLSEKHKRTSGPHAHSDVFEQAVLKCKSALSAYNPEKMQIRYSGKPVITLPCEPGGTIYAVEDRGGEGLEVVPYVVGQYEINKEGIYCYDEYHGYIGKLDFSVFGTEHEAILDIKERNNSYKPIQM